MSYHLVMVTVNIPVVAGGGSGSAQYGGGGGAGGLRTNLSGHPLAGDPVKVQPGTTNVTVGAGGQYATPPAMPGTAGGNSSIDPNFQKQTLLLPLVVVEVVLLVKNLSLGVQVLMVDLVVLVEVVLVALVLMHQTILVVLVMRWFSSTYKRGK